MGRVNTPILDSEAKNTLENAFKTGKKHIFRVRCQLVLLKSENRSSKEVAKIVKMCEMSVNNWLVRYASEGLEGLNTKSGRGRKALINKIADEFSVLEAVKTNRQRLQTAKSDRRSGRMGIPKRKIC